MNILKIKNFGAIKEAVLEVKKVNLYIGHTSSGKSTAAKLLAIFQSVELLGISSGDHASFTRLLAAYSIDFAFESDTEIFFQNNDFFWKVKKDSFETNNDEDAQLLHLAKQPDKLTEYLIQKSPTSDRHQKLLGSVLLLKKNVGQNKGIPTFIIESMVNFQVAANHQQKQPLYLPAERLLLTTLSNKMFSFLNAGASIPDCITRFGSLYEAAKANQKNARIDLLNIQTRFQEKEEDEIIMLDTKTRLKLQQASSGVQSLLPLWIVLNDNLRNGNPFLILLEEPELNLYPTVQLDFINWIMGKIRKSQSSIVITTHSPYILTAIDDLIMGYDAFCKNRRDREKLRKLAALLPLQSLLAFEEVASYYFAADGIIKDIKENESRSVGAEYLDQASERTSYIFNELCNM